MDDDKRIIEYYDYFYMLFAVVVVRDFFLLPVRKWGVLKKFFYYIFMMTRTLRIAWNESTKTNIQHKMTWRDNVHFLRISSNVFILLLWTLIQFVESLKLVQMKMNVCTATV